MIRSLRFFDSPALFQETIDTKPHGVRRDYLGKANLDLFLGPEHLTRALGAAEVTI